MLLFFEQFLNGLQLGLLLFLLARLTIVNMPIQVAHLVLPTTPCSRRAVGNRIRSALHNLSIHEK